MDIEFWYDFSSPWTYLASTQVESVVQRAGGKLIWRPMLLGAVFKQVGTPDVPALAMPESRRNYYSSELGLWAEHWNVPFKFSTRFPMRTVTALRLTLLAGDRIASLSHALFKALWVDDRDISADTELADILKAEGFDAESMLEQTQQPEVKQKLIDATGEAVKRGVFGAPTFIMKHPEGDVMLWGQDRLELVEKVLGGWRPRSA
jgi:2-hydroxychromene-2-carboxylate isomerase